MDPDQALKNLRALSSQILAIAAVETTPEGECTQARILADLAMTIADQAQALDDWMRSGGFTPRAWAKGPRNA